MIITALWTVFLAVVLSPSLEPPRLYTEPAGRMVHWTAVCLHAGGRNEPHLDAHQAVPSTTPRSIDAREGGVTLALDSILVHGLALCR